MAVIPTTTSIPLVLPVSKHDVEEARRLVEAGVPAVNPHLEELLTWFQDINWPVCQALGKLEVL